MCITCGRQSSGKNRGLIWLSLYNLRVSMHLITLKVAWAHIAVMLIHWLSKLCCSTKHEYGPWDAAYRQLRSIQEAHAEKAVL